MTTRQHRREGTIARRYATRPAKPYLGPGAGSRRATPPLRASDGTHTGDRIVAGLLVVVVILCTVGMFAGIVRHILVEGGLL